jgi:hypothetical protein
VLPLTGHSVNQGTGLEAVQSTVSGFELQAVSGALPTCASAASTNCVHFADERSADLKYVATTSNAPQLNAIGGDVGTDGFLYFSVTTQGPWRTAAASQEFDIYIDTNADKVPDAVVYNTRLGGQDTMVSELVDLGTGEVIDDEGINDRLGDTDTALMDSDTMVLPVAIGALPGVAGPSQRISYGIVTFSGYGLVDSVGFAANGDDLSGSLSTNPFRPGLAVYGSFDGSASPLLFQDQAGSVLNVRRDRSTYGYDHALGALIVHFHNTVGTKAQRMALKSVSRVGLTLSPTRAHPGTTITATVTVPADGGLAATGTVIIRHVGGGVLGSGQVVNGKAVVKFTRPAKGTYHVRAEYRGDSNYLAGNSAQVTLTFV